MQLTGGHEDHSQNESLFRGPVRRHWDGCRNDLHSHWWGGKGPAWLFLLFFVGIYSPLVVLAAYVLFNLGVPRPWNPTPMDIARKKDDEQGLLTKETLYATRALQVITDYDDEGPSYLLELIDGGVLFLSGYYLYRIATHRKDAGSFPCTEFTFSNVTSRLVRLRTLFARERHCRRRSFP